MDDLISRQAAIELFKDDIAAVNELNNLPSLPDRMKYVQESVNTIMNTCKSDSIKDKAFRNAARMIQNAIDGEAPDYETIEELPPTQPGWIPCNSGRFPEESGTYTVTAHDGATKRVTYAKYQKRLKRWELTGARAYWRVLAWMPLPKPWEGEKDDG